MRVAAGRLPHGLNYTICDTHPRKDIKGVDGGCLLCSDEDLCGVRPLPVGLGVVRASGSDPDGSLEESWTQRPGPKTLNLSQTQA